MILRTRRSDPLYSSAASDVFKSQQRSRRRSRSRRRQAQSQSRGGPRPPPPPAREEPPEEPKPEPKRPRGRPRKPEAEPNPPRPPGSPYPKPMVDGIRQHPAGAGTFHRGATSTGGLGSEPGQRRARRAPRPIDYPTARQAPRATRGQTPDSADHSAGGEGLPQTTPLLSSRGCKWGPNPLSSMNTYQPEVLCSAPKPSRDTPEGGSSSFNSTNRTIFIIPNFY